MITFIRHWFCSHGYHYWIIERHEHFTEMRCGYCPASYITASQELP